MNDKPNASDKELDALAIALEALKPLNQEAQRRILQYLAARFCNSRL